MLLGSLHPAANAEPTRRAGPRLPSTLVEGQLVVGKPTALPTGMTTGTEAAYIRGWPLAWGVRVGWSTATEYAQVRKVRHDDIRLQALCVLRHRIGRGTVGIRLGAGATLLHESRARSQGSRAGLTGEELEVSAWRLFPALELDPFVVVRLLWGFGVTLGGGPTLVWREGTAHAGWNGRIGVAWER